MIAYDEYRTGSLPYVRRVRALRAAGLLARTEREPVGEVPGAIAPGPAAVATPVAIAGGDARLLRRLRHVVRRRVRVDLAGLVATTVSDGDLTLRIETVSERDPRVIAWTADRLVALVVLHDGCGARVIGNGGLMGRLELPSAAGDEAFLAFCYDADAAPSPS